MDSQDAKKAIERWSLDDRRKALKKFRKECHLTQGELASRSGLNESTISRYERGSRDLSPEAFARVQDTIVGVMAEREVAKKLAAQEEADNIRKLVPLSSLGRPQTEEESAESLRAIRRDFGSYENFERFCEFASGIASQIVSLEQQLAALRKQNTSLREWIDQEQKAALEHAKAKELEEKILKSEVKT